MANSGKTVSFAPQPMMDSTSRPGLSMNISVRQDVKIQGAIDNAIKVLVRKGFTEVDAHDLVSSIKKPHDEKYRALEREYFLVRDRCNFLEQQLNLGRDLAPEELIRTNTVAHIDDSYAGEPVFAPSYIGGTTLPQSITNLNAGFQRELEALREENKALILEKDSITERLKELEQDREKHLEADAHLQILANKIENYKALLLTKENYAAEIDALTHERNDLAAALEELRRNGLQTDSHHESQDSPKVRVNEGVGTEDLEPAMSQKLSELIKLNQELYEENQILAAELDRVYSENTGKCPGGHDEENKESVPKKVPLKVCLDVSSITPESITFGMTEKPINAASTLQSTRGGRAQNHQPINLTELTIDTGTASNFRATDFFDELAAEESQVCPPRTEIQVTMNNPGDPAAVDITRTSSAVSPVSRGGVDYGDSKSISPAYRQAMADTPKKPVPLTVSPTTGKDTGPALQRDPKVELSETQMAELAQQLAMLETEKINAVREIEQIETAYKALQDTHEDLRRQYDELVRKYAIQENRINQLEETHLRMQELFNMKSPDRHISSIDVSQSSQQEKNARPVRPLVRIRESDLDVCDLTSSGHHITEGERFLEDPPSTSTQSFAELPDGDNKTGKVKTVLVLKEKCSQLESQVNFAVKKANTLMQEKRDLEEELEELDEQYKRLEATNKELIAEIDRLKTLLDKAQAEVLLFRTTNDGIRKQLKELLVNSAYSTTSASKEVARTMTNTTPLTTLLVEETRDLGEAVHNNLPGKVFAEDDVNKMMTELSVELVALRGEADKHQEAATVFANEIRSLQARIDSLYAESATKDHTLTQKTEEIKALSGKVVELQAEIDRLNVCIAKLHTQTAELDTVNATNRELTEQIRQLTAQLDRSKINQTDNNNQQNEMKQATELPVPKRRSVSMETEKVATSDVSLLVPNNVASVPTTLAGVDLLEKSTVSRCPDCSTNREIIDRLITQNDQAAVQISELQEQLSSMASTTEVCALLQKENRDYAASNQHLTLQLAEVEQAYKHTTDLISKYENQIRHLKEEMSSMEKPLPVAFTAMLHRPVVPTEERWTQPNQLVTLTQGVQVDTQPFASTFSEKESGGEDPAASSASLTIDRFLESIAKTNRILGLEQEPVTIVDDVKNSTTTLARLIDQHTARMEKRLNEYAKLVNLQAQCSKDDQQVRISEQAFSVESAQLNLTNYPCKMGLSLDVIATLQNELRLISDHVRTNNENISSVARTTELAFNRVREALVTRTPEQSQKQDAHTENAASPELLLYADLLQALLENIVRLNSRLDTMEQDRQSLIVDLALHLGLPQSTNETALKEYIRDLATAKTTIDPGVLIENIADLKKGVLETNVQLQAWEEHVREHVRAASAPIAANALAILDHDKSASLSSVKADAVALQLSNIDAKQAHEQSSHHTEGTVPNTVEHILQQSTSHDIRSAHESIQQTLKSIVDATSNCNDAKQKYLEEQIEILEAENTRFKEYNASYVKKLAEQTEEITRLQSINHQLSLKIAEHNSFQEQIQMAEHTRQGITEQIRNVRSTLIEIKTCIQSDRSDGEENATAPTKESKGIEAVEEKLIELTESACNWRLKYEKANAERKEMRARARTENALRIKVEKAHKKLERNFAQLQTQLKEGAESLAWLKAATARYIEAVQQELDRINGLHLDRD